VYTSVPVDRILKLKFDVGWESSHVAPNPYRVVTYTHTLRYGNSTRIVLNYSDLLYTLYDLKNVLGIKTFDYAVSYTGNFSTNYYKIMQVYRGLPVRNGWFLFDSDLHGEYVDLEDTNININPSIPHESAFKILEGILGVDEARAVVMVDLIVYDKETLAWAFNYSGNRGVLPYYYIDAHTGEFLLK
jgi:hypothetical protein